MFHKYLQTTHLVLIFHCMYVLQRLVCALGMVLAKGILVTPICRAWLAQYPEIDFPSIQGRLIIALSYFFLLVGTLEQFTIYILFHYKKKKRRHADLEYYLFITSFMILAFFFPKKRKKSLKCPYTLSDTTGRKFKDKCYNLQPYTDYPSVFSHFKRMVLIVFKIIR